MRRYPNLDPVFVSAAEMSRNFGQWQDRAIAGPVMVTHHGRARVAIISAEHFQAWRDGEDDPEIKTRPVAAEASLSTVLAHIGEGFCSIDLNYRFVSVNGAACTFFGLSPNQIIGRSVQEAFPEAEGSIFMDRMRRVQRTGEELTYNGSSTAFPSRFIEAKIFPHPDGIGIVFKNVTDEVIRERSRLEYQDVINVLCISENLGYIRLNIRGFPVSCSESLHNITGLSHEHICHAKLVELFPMSERSRIQNSLERVFDLGKSILLKSKIYAKGDADIEVELNIAPTFDEAGVTGALVLVDFISNRTT